MNELENTINNLAKYCHSDKCKKIHDCPLKHGKCKDNLDLDTAIAWHLYLKGKDFMEEKDSVNKKEILYQTIAYSVLLDFHKEKYQELYKLSFDIVKQMINNL